MKISSLNLLVKSSIKRNVGKNIFFLVFLAFAVVLTTVTVSVMLPFCDNVENKLNNHLYNRMFNVEIPSSTVDTAIKKVNDTHHVQDVYTYLDSMSVSDITGTLESEYTMCSLVHEAAPLIVDGRLFRDDERNVAIVPDNIRDYSQSQRKLKNINGSDLVGKQLTFLTEGDDYTVTVVGTYSLSDPMFTGKQIIIPEQEMKSLNDKIQLENNNSFIDDEQYDGEKKSIFTVLVDNHSNTDDVIENISNQGIDCHKAYKLNFDTASYQVAAVILMIMFALLIVMVFVAVSAFVNNHIKSRTVEIAMYRALGYRSSNIFIILFAEYLVMGIIALAFGLGISLIVLQATVNPYLNEFLGQTIMTMTASITPINLLVMVCTIILIELLACLIATKKTNVIKLMILLQER
ncbi:MAG TPA: ABC transporter permease [Clostridiales bacterium]|nr:ABC transporter permease [Clostridiales bacterium]